MNRVRLLLAMMCASLLMVTAAQSAVPTKGTNGTRPRSASMVYQNARLNLCAVRPDSEDEVARVLTTCGLKDSGAGWGFEDEGASIGVFALVSQQSYIISYAPKLRKPMPDAVISALIAKAKSVEFSGPDQITCLFEWDPPPGQSGNVGKPNSEYVSFSMQDGAWLMTQAFIRPQ